MALVNKNVLVTGGSDGIGKSLVLEFFKKGAANIVVLDVKETTVPASIAEKIIFLKTDVSDAEQVRKSFQEAIAQLGHLDIVIANAGVFNEYEPQRTVQVNLVGVMNTSYAAIEYMCKTKGGRGGVVLNNASILGLDYAYSLPSYVATKHGIIGFTRCLGDEYYFKKHGIKFVITFCPGFTDTAMPDGIASKLVTKDSSELDFICEKLGMQKPDVVAESVTNLVDAKNGSIWMINDGITTEVEPKIFWKQF